MISFRANFNPSDLQKMFNDDLQNILDEFAQKMFDAGKKVVDLARQQTKAEGGFGNITWNLRGSIGCALLINHELPEEYIYFPPLSQGEEGRQKGIAFAKEIALLVDDGDIILIMVAGEEYAAYVEAMEDYDVLSGSAMQFDSLLRSVIK